MNKNNDDNFDLESELAKSIEKLVDEETSVAKAFVDRNSLNDESTKTLPVANDDFSKTKAIPEIPSRQVMLDIDDEIDEDEDEDLEDNDADVEAGTEGKKTPVSPKKLDKKTKLIIAGVVAAVVVVIIAIIITAVAMNNKNKSSYDYNYKTGTEYYNSKKYDDARPLLEKAAASSSGRKNINLKFMLYDCYISEGNNTKAVEMLTEILSYEKNNEKALTALAAYYSSSKNGDKLTELIRTYKGTDGEKYLKSYMVTSPTASDAAGNYTKALDLEITSPDGYAIYYTLDGSNPTVKSTLYTAMIHLVKGTTTVKAVAVNNIGTASDILELKYVIEYKAPDAPELSPATGKTYEEGQKITITNLKPGDTAYYTLDNSTPSKASTKYEGEFAMPVGNSVVSVITINEYGLESNITRKNYICNAVKTYTFEQALTLLKTRMKTLGELKTDTTTADGKTVNFVFNTNTKISDTDMYLVFYDIAGTRQKYYFGIGIKNGKCYKVTESNGTYAASEY